MPDDDLRTREAAVSPDRSRRRSRRRRRDRALLIILLLATGVGWHASLRGPVAERRFEERVEPPRAAPAAPDCIRVGVFNMHRGKDAEGHRDLERIAETLEEAGTADGGAGMHLVGLNEVAGAGLLGGADQASWLGARLGLAATFLPVQRRYYRDYHGNGLLSRFPIGPRVTRPLPISDDHHRHRGYTETSIEIGERAVPVIVTHLDNGPDRHEELEIVLARFRTFDHGILLGDFNMYGDDAGLRRALDDGVDDPLGIHLGETDEPTRRDWILTRGLATTDAGVIDLGASDHPCYWVELVIDALDSEGGRP